MSSQVGWTTDKVLHSRLQWRMTQFGNVMDCVLSMARQQC
jgi:hypothetical protein